MLPIARPKDSKQPAPNFFSSSRISDFAVGHSAIIAQLGQDAIIATPPNLNFAETISNRMWQFGQQSACSSPITRADATFFAFGSSLTVDAVFCDLGEELLPVMSKGIALYPPCGLRQFSTGSERRTTGMVPTRTARPRLG